MTGKNVGRVIGVTGNMVTVDTEGDVFMNEVGYVVVEEQRLKAEVIRIRGKHVEMQVFEMTRGIGIGDAVEFSGELLSVRLGPGLLGQIYDGLQNPLPLIAEKHGFFLQRGVYLPPLSEQTKWDFSPLIDPGQSVTRGMTLGTVPEGIFKHRIMVPYNFYDRYTVERISAAGQYTIQDTVAELKDSKGNTLPVGMSFEWPVKRPIDAYDERLKPSEPLITKVRIIDTFFPVARGGTYCIPGPFGAGKTVLQQITSRNAEVDIVVIAACGERAGEVVETLREFPELLDPRTGRSLMERTVIIVNTSSMPVAAREASVYTGVTIAEHYRQMGLNVLLLADSTSRWAQAMREMSGRLEEIPGEEAFPAYLESVIAAFYERAGTVRLKDKSTGSVTIGGTVSPAGGNFEEPVTQSTLKVVGAFHGLSRERSDARKYPAIHPLDSWSKYAGAVESRHVEYARRVIDRGNEVAQMMKVVGEEGTSLEDYVVYLKAEFLDAVYLQQNAFDPVDAAVSTERQRHCFGVLLLILAADLDLPGNDEARSFFYQLRQKALDWNSAAWDSEEFGKLEEEIKAQLQERKKGVLEEARQALGPAAGGLESTAKGEARRGRGAGRDD